MDICGHIWTYVDKDRRKSYRTLLLQIVWKHFELSIKNIKKTKLQTFRENLNSEWRVLHDVLNDRIKR